MLRKAIICALLAVGLLGVELGAAAAAEAATYKGRTAQKRGIRIAGNARSIKLLRFKIELKCRNGTILVDDESGFLRTPLRSGGRFRDRQFGSTDTVLFRGRRHARLIRGQIRVIDRLGNGVRCNSGWVKFSARVK